MDAEGPGRGEAGKLPILICAARPRTDGGRSAPLAPGHITDGVSTCDRGAEMVSMLRDVEFDPVNQIRVAPYGQRFIFDRKVGGFSRSLETFGLSPHALRYNRRPTSIMGAS